MCVCPPAGGGGDPPTISNMLAFSRQGSDKGQHATAVAVSRHGGWCGVREHYGLCECEHSNANLERGRGVQYCVSLWRGGG